MTNKDRTSKTKKQRDQEYYLRNRERILAYSKAYRKAKPMSKEAAAAKARRTRANNPDRYRAYNMKRWYEKRDAWLAANGPCVRCGSSERLEVDHIDPSGKLDHKVWSWAEERRLVELVKCQVLCFLCHRLKTNEERGWNLHGEVRYQMGCRCQVCERVHAKKLRTIELKRMKVAGPP